MNQANSNFINQLLDDSELFKPTRTQYSPKESYDFSKETLLITGASGSIGSGILKQLIDCRFKTLILVDNVESSLYYLIDELELNKKPNIEFLLTDIRDESSMQWLFEKFKPSIVFHTAAYKHVPLMESHPYEAIRLNILATQMLADLAMKHFVKKFIFISTDKAVKPIGVMGMTKYLAEYYLKKLNTQNGTSFLIARFGNILGSNGSVASLFIKQIEAGKSITVTNKNISRYFITKNKASHLILKMATFEKLNDCTVTFNMGQPIKIIDLAKAITARLKIMKHDIKILNTTNLRSGEKLHEDIVSENETLETTSYADIFLVKNALNNNLNTIDFDDLKKINPSQSPSEIKALLETFIQNR